MYICSALLDWYTIELFIGILLRYHLHYLLDCALYFFRDRIEAAFTSREYAGNNERHRMGKNDSIFARLDVDFSFDGALQHSIGVKGCNVTRNQIRQMLKNWKKQGLIVQTEVGRYRKV